MEKYSIVYIDDQPDTELTKFLDRSFHSDDYEIAITEIVFDTKEGYESILSDTRVSSANIVIIDSRLFENRTADEGKFTGEEFKLILKKIYPFIEVIVITQNEIDSPIIKIAKYDKSCGKTALEYYADKIPSQIEKAVDNIKQYRLLAEIVNKNSIWETVLKEKINNTLQGKNTYDELTKTDIDYLISEFKKIQESINDG